MLELFLAFVLLFPNKTAIVQNSCIYLVTAVLGFLRRSSRHFGVALSRELLKRYFKWILQLLI